MRKNFTLTIARVDEPIFSGDAISVSVPGTAGTMEILADHEPLVSPLKAGVVTYTTPDAQKHTIDTAGGMLEVAHNHATILL